MIQTSRPARRVTLSLVTVSMLIFSACGGTAAVEPTPFQGFDGCQAGADSAIAFLERTLEEIGEADVDEVRGIVPNFDGQVETMALRAREVHCTEQGFNRAIINRADELIAGGPAAEALIASVKAFGLGSLEPEGGGLITLPGG